MVIVHTTTIVMGHQTLSLCVRLIYYNIVVCYMELKLNKLLCVQGFPQEGAGGWCTLLQVDHLRLFSCMQPDL